MSAENGSICKHHSGIASDIRHLDDTCRAHSKEISNLKKWLLGFMLALLIGVYGSWLYQVRTNNGPEKAQAAEYTEQVK